MELREIARSQRRRQVQEALDFERDREAALRGQLAETAMELEGPSVDEETFAEMDPEDVAIVKEAFVETDHGFSQRLDGEADEDWLEEFLEAESPEIERVERLGEVARLEGEIEDSRRRQQALQRYLDALAAPSADA